MIGLHNLADNCFDIQPAEVGGLGELLTADGALRSLPSQLANLGGIDGFYAARLRRT